VYSVSEHEGGEGKPFASFADGLAFQLRVERLPRAVDVNDEKTFVFGQERGVENLPLERVRQ
jgi:hypothetical protein